MLIESTSDSPRLLHRILCAFIYMGVAPVAYLFRYHHKSDFTRHHTTHALSSSFIMQVTFLLFLVLYILTILLGIFREDIYYAIRLEIVKSILFILTFSTLLILTAISMFYAVKGKSTRVPILSRVSQKTWMPAFTLLLSLVFFLVLLLIILLSCYSLSITPQSSNNAKVYMIYEDADFFPRWIFTLGFLPVTRRASIVLGLNSMCVCKWTDDTFKQAFSKGKFIFLATHGAGPGMIYANSQVYKATDALIASDGNQPHFIYISACSLGKDDDSWNRIFPKSEIVSFDRWSAVLEHMWWLYSEGPDKLESLFP